MTTTEELPAAVATYLAAREAREVERTAATFAEDAAVTDEGHTYRGRDEITSWLGRSGSEYTYTTTLTGITTLDDAHVEVTQHLAGDFPGGQVDLHFRFTLDGGSIVALVIEP